MRPFAITDEKILKEQQELVDKYMENAPENVDMCEFIFANCSEYYKKFYDKRRSQKEK